MENKNKEVTRRSSKAISAVLAFSLISGCASTSFTENLDKNVGTEGDKSDAYSLCMDFDKFERLLAGKNIDGTDKGFLGGFFSAAYAMIAGGCYPVAAIGELIFGENEVIEDESAGDTNTPSLPIEIQP